MNEELYWAKRRLFLIRSKEEIKERKEKYCRQISERQREKNGPNWKGGRIKASGGYIRIYAPTHPFAINKTNKKYPESGGYVAEHRLVMEKHLGRFMRPEEVVHHINGKRDDNRIDNLVLFPTVGAHLSFHRRQLKCRSS